MQKLKNNEDRQNLLVLIKRTCITVVVNMQWGTNYFIIHQASFAQFHI